MSVLVPLNDFGYLDRYLDAGADQFYCGFYDDAWMARFGPYADLNRMSGFGSAANAYNFDGLVQIVGAIRATGRRIYVPFNAGTYTGEQIEWQRWYFSELAAAGASGVIVSLPEQVTLAAECGLDPVISTMGAVYNTRLVRYYAALGVKRIILPRDLSLAEIEAIVREVPELEYEVFLMRNGCIYSDSHCLGMHGHGRGALCYEMKHGVKQLLLSPEAAQNMSAGEFTQLQDAYRASSRLYCEVFHQYTCGLCALWRLSQLGIAAYKIVGRSDDADALCQDIALANDNLRIAYACESEAEYLRSMQPHPYRETVCDNGLNCYYPEVKWR